LLFCKKILFAERIDKEFDKFNASPLEGEKFKPQNTKVFEYLNFEQ